MSRNPLPAIFSGLRSCRSCQKMPLRSVWAVAGPSRGMASGSDSEGSTAPSSVYPFSSALTTYPTTTQPPKIQKRLLHPRNGKFLVDHLNSQAISTSLDPTGNLTRLFSRRNPNRLKPGSVLSVVSYNTPARTTTSVFSGVLLGIRRRGVDTAFTLRNVVNKTGVEVGFKVYSPMIKEIVVVKKADGKKNGLKDLGRAKVNYLREKTATMNTIAVALKEAERKA